MSVPVKCINSNCNEYLIIKVDKYGWDHDTIIDITRCDSCGTLNTIRNIVVNNLVAEPPQISDVVEYLKGDRDIHYMHMDHTADLMLVVVGNNLPDVMWSGVWAMMDCILDMRSTFSDYINIRNGIPEMIDFELYGDSTEDLFFNIMREALYEYSTRYKAPLPGIALDIGYNELKGKHYVRGKFKLLDIEGDIKIEVKNVTRHCLEVSDTHAVFVLDV
jgi:SHS2 domain-containing protein